MADAISTNDSTPISIVIEANGATITVVPEERVQKQLRDIAAAGIDMQLVTDWITAKYINSIQPVHELIASDVSDLWQIRTSNDAVRILQLEIEQRKTTRKSYWNDYIAPVFPTEHKLLEMPEKRYVNLNNDPQGLILMNLDYPRHNLSSTSSLYGNYHWNSNTIPSLPERYHRHEDFLSPELREAHEQLVNYLGIALFRNRTPEEIAEEILRDSTALSEAMSEAAEQIVSDGGALGDAMSERAKTLASEAFTVSPTLPIEDHLAVPKVDTSAPTEDDESPRVHGKETEVEIPSIYGGMYVEQQPRSRVIGDLDRQRGYRRPRRPVKDGK